MATVLSVPADDFVRLWSATRDKRATGILPSTEANITYICQELGLRIDEDTIKRAAWLRFQYTSPLLTALRPGAVETLSQLKSEGSCTGLISNCAPEVPLLWQKTALAPLIDIAIFSSCVGLSKPDPRIYRLATDRLQVEPANCLYVGDGDNDELSGATQAGMRVVRITVLLEDVDDDPRTIKREWHGPVISSLREVLTLVR
jgi:putative hydrolase of the HAD superfamily